MNRELMEQFLAEYSEPEWLEMYGGRFEVVSCLAEAARGETFLMSEKETDTLYVLKIQRDLTICGDEAALLKGLTHRGLPMYEQTTEAEGARYCLRKYIEGEPLNSYIEKNPSAQDMINVMAQLCDILTYLHERSEPIIHRDIKPSNIIFNESENRVTLIDFGISRRFNEGAEADTVYFGTQKFAPPEQYGFAQTDARSDIFSMGMVMRYWLTGTTDRQVEIADASLSAIVEKCTRLEPDMRWQSAAELKNALTRRGTRKPTLLRGLVGRAAVFVLFFIALGVGAVILSRGGADMTEPYSTEPHGTPDSYEYAPVEFAAVDIQLMARENMNWNTHAGEVVTIRGNGTYTARLEIAGGYTGFVNLGIMSAGATLSGYPYLMSGAELAPARFYNAYIYYEYAVINDSLVLDIRHTEEFDHRFVRGHWATMEGYIFSKLWNAWNDIENRLMGVERVVGWYGHDDKTVMFTIAGVDAITSIEVTFTIVGAADE